MASFYTNLGLLHQTRGELDEAEAMYREGLTLSEALGYKVGMAANYVNLGILYKSRGQLDEAEAMYRKSLALDEALGHKEGMASDYANLGILYQTRGELDEAEAMYRKSLVLFQAVGAMTPLASTENQRLSFLGRPHRTKILRFYRPILIRLLYLPKAKYQRSFHASQ